MMVLMVMMVMVMVMMMRRVMMMHWTVGTLVRIAMQVGCETKQQGDKPAPALPKKDQEPPRECATRFVNISSTVLDVRQRSKLFGT